MINITRMLIVGGFTTIFIIMGEIGDYLSNPKKYIKEMQQLDLIDHIMRIGTYIAFIAAMAFLVR